jgi:hypothetical protein
MLGNADSEQYLFSVYNTGFGKGKNAHFRIQKLFFPVGKEEALYPVYELDSDPPIAGQKAGFTKVKNVDGTAAVYFFTKEMLLDKVQRFDQAGQLKKEKAYFWRAGQWLEALEVRDEKGLLYRKSYQYDGFGNPTKEIFSGDLSGEGKEERYCIAREFSQDGKHLLLKEETEEGKITFYQYLPGTNLITSKIIKDKNQLLLREFFQI